MLVFVIRLFLLPKSFF
uniref:Uncharacterized protein n=1 Tax=Anguilla anguilla TaxID=7936 RepID=A0A0E9P893_ANGAN